LYSDWCQCWLEGFLSPLISLLFVSADVLLWWKS